MSDGQVMDRSRGCTGWCAAVCRETASDPGRMAHILIFASRCKGGDIVCDRGTHRSLSAALILQLFFHRKLVYKYAAKDHGCPCGRHATKNMDSISAAFRTLENPGARRNLLSDILGLPPLVKEVFD